MTNAKWDTESIRLTLLGNVEPGLAPTWLSMTGQQPDSVTNRPAQGVQLEEGQWAGGHLVVSCQPGRIEIVLTAMPRDPSEIASLGTFLVALTKFEEIISKVTYPKVSRLAVGAKINVFFDTEKQVSEFISSQVPDFKPSKEYCDLMLQYNLPKKFAKIGGLILNRIIKMSQFVMHTVQFTSTQQLGNDAHPVAQIEYDFNTSPASTLPHQDNYGGIVKAIFAELRAQQEVEA